MPKALITGGTKGIGYSIAEHLVKGGHDVVITYLHDHESALIAQKKLAEVYDISVSIVQADSGSQDDLQRIFQEQNGFDVLVNNIGSPFPDDGSNRSAMFHYHLMGTVHATEYFVSQLSGKGSIVNITSVAGSHPGAWHKCMRLESYCCMKAAVEMYTKICANKYQGKVHVNAVSPGNTLTPGRDGADPAFIKAREENSCIKRFVDPDEIGQAVAGIVTNKGINGQILVVDGGEVARGYE